MLSHPQIVEAAEELFVPACVYNNVDGPDAEVLAAFEEDAWNNPVVRIVDTGGRDLVARNGRDWTVGAVASSMVDALVQREREVPTYLGLLSWSESARHAGTETAIFGMA